MGKERNKANAKYFDNPKSKQMWHMLRNKGLLSGSSDDPDEINVNVASWFAYNVKFRGHIFSFVLLLSFFKMPLSRLPKIYIVYLPLQNISISILQPLNLMIAFRVIPFAHTPPGWYNVGERTLDISRHWPSAKPHNWNVKWTQEKCQWLEHFNQGKNFDFVPIEIIIISIRE